MRRSLQISSWLLYLLVLGEISARAFLAATYNVPFLRPQQLIYNIYPELKAVVEADLSRDGANYNVLLLGASVLTPEWGNIEEELQARIPHASIYNLAVQGHTSLDSYYKYAHLEDKRFDLVIFYHGINEVRLNNIPAERFRSDYSHYSWYYVLNSFDRLKGFPLALPHGFNLAVFEMGKISGATEVIPRMATEMPEEHVREHGSDIKTAATFGNNLQKILEIAEKRGDPLMVGAFATHLPEDYTLEKFLKKELSYGEHKSPIEIWGLPENVLKGVSEHNRELRRLASEKENVIFIDFDVHIPKTEEYFDDICHLSSAGGKLFAELIADNVSGSTSAEE